MADIKTIPEGWMETTLGEVVDIQSGKSRPKDTGTFPVYGGNGILDYANNFNIEKSSIIVGRVGAYCGCVYFERSKFWLSDNALGIQNNTKSDIKFLYYFLINQNLNKKAIGGAQPLITQGILNGIEITIPLFPEQQAIARMLSSFDDKIELLRNQNETLEKISQTIFQEWFGKYGVEDKLPEGWRVGSFTEQIDILSGGTPSTSVEEYWNGEIPWFSVVDTPVNGIFVLTTEKHISQSGVQNSATKILPINTTILTARGTVGKTALTGVEMAMNQSCYGIKSKIGCDYYAHHLTKRMLAVLKSRVHGAVFDTITRGTIDGIETIIPNNEMILKFEAVLIPIYDRLKHNAFQIIQLSKTRDQLLPRLMSGEVRVEV